MADSDWFTLVYIGLVSTLIIVRRARLALIDFGRFGLVSTWRVGWNLHRDDVQPGVRSTKPL